MIVTVLPWKYQQVTERRHSWEYSGALADDTFPASDKKGEVLPQRKLALAVPRQAFLDTGQGPWLWELPQAGGVANAPFSL